ncbi:hypothetical protein T484DRAFT_1915343 [Baffinella frigidus]|nr:hypothetical protein T484DRAFT_1915343 [Cryptophyta sp. CCMP2293]
MVRWKFFEKFDDTKHVKKVQLVSPDELSGDAGVLIADWKAEPFQTSYPHGSLKFFKWNPHDPNYNSWSDQAVYTGAEKTLMQGGILVSPYDYHGHDVNSFNMKFDDSSGLFVEFPVAQEVHAGQFKLNGNGDWVDKLRGLTVF